MDLLEKLIYTECKRLNLSDVSLIKDRKDRSTLFFHSMFPEIFLSEDVAYPDKVKKLAVDVGFDNGDGSNCGLCNSIKDCENCCNWDGKYTETLCSGLTKFHNLETLIAVDLDLSTELWIEFAKNCKCLKEIYFDSARIQCKTHDCFWFQEGKEKALDALFQIPTLERVYIGFRICLPYIPPGPSNIKYLELKEVEVDNYNSNGEDKISNEIYSKNLHTHQNIKTLILTQGRYNPFKLEDLQLNKMENLEELIFKFGDDIEMSKILPPNLKKIHLLVDTNKKKIVNVFKPILTNCPKIEEIRINARKDKNLTQLGKEVKEDLKKELKECKSIKKILFVSYYDESELLNILDSA